MKCDSPMASAVVKARKVGGSIMVRVPKEVVEQEDIKPGELVEVQIRKARKSAFGIFPNLPPFTREDELDTHE